MTDMTDTQALSEQVATERYRAAWLAHAEAFTRADKIRPGWQEALAQRAAAFEALIDAQVRLREAHLAIGYTERHAALRRAEIERAARRGQS